MGSIGVRLFFGCIIAYLITWYMVPVCIKLAQRLRIIDAPDGIIKNHKNPTPYLGGIALFIGFLTSISFVVPFENSSLFLLVIGLSLIVFLGLLDDVLTLSPGQKIMGQAVIALALVKAGFYLKSHAFYNPLTLGLSFLWIITLMNAFNLVDIMDGLATILALCSALLFLITAIFFHNYEAALLLSALIGSLCAFFYFNKPPARIYMGDTGSLFLGTFFGAIPFLCNWGTCTVYGYCAPVLFLIVPLTELVLLIVIRTYKGIPFYCGSADHYALYLKRAHFSVPAILLISATVALLVGGVTVIWLVGLS